MATAFTTEEKEVIRKKLHKVAKECLQRYGVKKTTVDQMAAMVDISKGSFYNFYSSKEMLFFAVLEEYQIDVMNRLTEQLDMEAKIDTSRLVELLYDFYQGFRYSFMYTIFKNNEMELLIRKLPKEAITNHHLIDDRMVKKIVSRINIKENVSVEIVSALFRTIAMTILHIEEIGEEQFDIALKFVIQGIVEQITKEDR
ncbi:MULTISPECIES: TetR/AcrR family transcriptional regulator [Streptococcus]|uniref:Bacterial regulatory protein, tetR family n=3 Tax=Streptococcus TaxID=1301 RepID=A0A428IMY9_STROR|nr:TetR/AcrR family transcriptional regulator [Streptococcus oralis]ORO76993.1 TetR family transcriptional regulator [Streptococcus oralis subsp. dentisani]RSJ04188.1 Bacterial regulatory protein, tetR family [Streptococcus mitis]QPT00986.1 TetR/AcrR family transcriptional regulator [Streptococcus oralis]RSK19030.1 Bacterial regulatory protein, tetR family [Streptococcus oralis]CAK1608453.1 TetR/AcrR family transcriptional regulator [Streptococcus oralis subsp. dentisani]